MTAITGPRHPLRAALDAARAPWTEEQTRIVGAMLTHHRKHGPSTEGVYQVTWDEDGPTNWELIGPAAEHSHRLSEPDYVSVIDERPLHLGAQLWPDTTGSLRDLQDANDAADDLTGDLAIVLALLAASEVLEWDTDETIRAAAGRLARDQIWRTYQGNPVPTVRIPPGMNRDWAEALDTLKLALRTPAECAAAYLGDRERINQTLTAHGIGHGWQALAERDVVRRLGVKANTWSGYITRGTAPAADLTGPNRWHVITIRAYELTQSGAR